MSVWRKTFVDATATQTLESQSFTLVPLVGHAPGLTLVTAPCPLDQLNEKKLPVLLYPHGGPHMSDVSYSSSIITHPLMEQTTVFNAISAAL